VLKLILVAHTNGLHFYVCNNNESDYRTITGYLPSPIIRLSVSPLVR